MSLSTASGSHVFPFQRSGRTEAAHAPGTGTPEPGGLTSRELLEILRGLRGTNLIGADVVEVAPPYDHAEITGIAAARPSCCAASKRRKWRCWPAARP